MKELRMKRKNRMVIDLPTEESRVAVQSSIEVAWLRLRLNQLLDGSKVAVVNKRKMTMIKGELEDGDCFHLKQQQLAKDLLFWFFFWMKIAYFLEIDE